MKWSVGKFSSQYAILNAHWDWWWMQSAQINVLEETSIHMLKILIKRYIDFVWSLKERKKVLSWCYLQLSVWAWHIPPAVAWCWFPGETAGVHESGSQQGSSCRSPWQLWLEGVYHCSVLLRNCFMIYFVTSECVLCSVKW